jgi:hypothetical protein
MAATPAIACNPPTVDQWDAKSVILELRPQMWNNVAALHVIANNAITSEFL